jgi:hypothetical protein
VPWIWEMVRGGFEPNWWAREAWESTAVSVAEVGVEIALSGEGWFGGVLGVLGEGVGAMSPGATLVC